MKLFRFALGLMRLQAKTQAHLCRSTRDQRNTHEEGTLLRIVTVPSGVVCVKRRGRQLQVQEPEKLKKRHVK